MIRKVGIGFLGLGTVGEQVLALIKEKQLVEEELNIEFEIHSIFVRDTNKKRNVDVTGIYMTSNYEEVINNPNIQVCFECMGGAGADSTVEIVTAAMKKGKHVIMSSKKCLAQNMNQILEAANYYNVQLRFEATVGGAIPICRTIMNMSKKNKITRMFGIVNATTNYVISLMEQSDIDFNKALEIAREKGITENDSSEDIDGWDAAYKMKILTRIGMNLDVDCKEIFPESSNTIERCKISDDASVRQIFCIERQEENRVLYYIGPAELDKNSIMGSVRENYNVIFVDSSCSGLRAYYGKGAGGKETASVMYEDLLDIYKQCYWYEAANEAVCNKINSKEVKMTEQ